VGTTITHHSGKKAANQQLVRLNGGQKKKDCHRAIAGYIYTMFFSSLTAQAVQERFFIAGSCAHMDPPREPTLGLIKNLYIY